MSKASMASFAGKIPVDKNDNNNSKPKSFRQRTTPIKSKYKTRSTSPNSNSGYENETDKDIIVIAISKIFSWFKDDFTQKGTLIDWINAYADIKVKPTAKVSYLKYDWNLNK